MTERICQRTAVITIELVRHCHCYFATTRNGLCKKGIDVVYVEKH